MEDKVIQMLNLSLSCHLLARISLTGDKVQHVETKLTALKVNKGEQANLPHGTFGTEHTILLNR